MKSLVPIVFFTMLLFTSGFTHATLAEEPSPSPTPKARPKTVEQKFRDKNIDVGAQMENAADELNSLQGKFMKTMGIKDKRKPKESPKESPTEER